ncbi:hypothetical protein ACFX15_033539 [Malus domestica]
MHCDMIPFYFLSLLLIALASTTTGAAYSSHNCSTSLAPNSTGTSFKSYLNQLLSNLSSNANHDATGFYNATTVGPAYGLFLCRRDVSANACKECVVNAASQALLLCPDSQEALISYDNCTLSYSNKPFSSWAAVTSPVLVIWSPQDLSQYVEKPANVAEVLRATLGSLVPKAANAIDRFATEERLFQSNLISSAIVYSLAQCRPDLSAADCNACLEEGKTQLAPSCCDAKQGGRVLYDSCNMRFEMNPFYQDVITPTSPTNKSGRSKPSSMIIIVSTLGSFAFCVLVVFGTGCFFRKRLRTVKDRYHSKRRMKKVGNDMKTVESLQFRLGTIETATNKFSDDNKLGEGGFGAVFKGTLGDGHEIAVKRLSKSSTQGVQEFQNEVVLVAKLQHRNLVRLLGFCLEGEETLLVYEYVPNKSLDHFLFGL